MAFKIIADISIPRDELIAKMNAWAARSPAIDPEHTMVIRLLDDDNLSWAVNSEEFIEELQKGMEKEENAK